MLWVGHVAGQLDPLGRRLNPNQLLGQLSAIQGADPIPPAVDRRQVVHHPLVVPQREMDVRPRQRDASKRLAPMPQLGLRRAKELSPHRRVVKQRPHLHRRADRHSARPQLRAIPARRLHFRPRVLAGRSAANQQIAHLGDRRQRLAAKSQRAHAKQIIRVADLACGVSRQRQTHLIGSDAAAVVGNPHQLGAALVQSHIDTRGPGVDAVLHQLLDHAGGPLNHLPRRDLVDHAGRQLADLRRAERRGGWRHGFLS